MHAPDASPPPTVLLYHRDPLLMSFTARVVAHGTWNGQRSIVLEETAFYPEAGGQMADHGHLGGFALKDVQIDDAGVVHHVVDGALPTIGVHVQGEIDARRRRQFMAQHTGQHMLSRAFLDDMKAETVSSRLGESVCTIDLAVPYLSEAALHRAEARVNAVIDADWPVRAFFPTPEELPALALRRAPKVSENIRVVEVAGFDMSPCGGTHVLRTSQIGLVRVLGAEKYKGMTRVSFVAGPQAREQAFARAAALEELGRSLSSSPEDVAGAIEKLRAEQRQAQAVLKKQGERLAVLLADAALARDAGAGDVVTVVDDADVDVLRAMATHIVTSRPAAAALLAARDADGLAVLVSRGASSTLDCGALLKKITAVVGGKGGGRPESAQGRVPAGCDWPALVAQNRS